MFIVLAQCSLKDAIFGTLWTTKLLTFKYRFKTFIVERDHGTRMFHFKRLKKSFCYFLAFNTLHYTECIKDLDWTLAKEGKWLLLEHFWPLLKWWIFWVSLISNRQIKLGSPKCPIWPSPDTGFKPDLFSEEIYRDSRICHFFCDWRYCLLCFG